MLAKLYRVLIYIKALCQLFTFQVPCRLLGCFYVHSTVDCASVTRPTSLYDVRILHRADLNGFSSLELPKELYLVGSSTHRPHNRPRAARLPRRVSLCRHLHTATSRLFFFYLLCINLIVQIIIFSFNYYYCCYFLLALFYVCR